MAKTPEQIERDKARNAAIREAKDTVRKFFSDKAFNALAEDIQNALRTLAPIARQATNTLAIELAGLFSKKSDLTELDVFKALKVGPNEMKAKVNHVLKGAAPEDRQWISYDPIKCIWSHMGTGADMPENYDENTLVPGVAARVTDERFAEMSINQMIAADKE